MRNLFLASFWKKVTTMLNWKYIELEMCQYDTDAPAQGHPQHTKAFYKKKWRW